MSPTQRTVVTVAALASATALGLAGTLPGEAVAGILGAAIGAPLGATATNRKPRP